MIGLDAFANCTGLTSVIVGSGVIDGHESFINCTSLSDVTLKEGLTNIGRNMFANCTSLSNITIPNSVTLIKYGAFHGCTSLTEITIPSGVTSIGDYAFDGSNNLKNIIIESSTPATLGIDSFNISGNDWYIYVPNSSVDTYKTAWATYASHIKPMSALYEKTLVVKYNVVTDGYGENFAQLWYTDEYGVSPFAKVEMDDGSVYTEEIPQGHMFATPGEHVVKYTMSDDSTAISDSLFGANMITDVLEAIVPSCITYIGWHAFNSEHRSLNKLTVYASVPPILQEDGFTCPIYVPAESVDVYKTAWSNYANLIQAM